MTGSTAIDHTSLEDEPRLVPPDPVRPLSDAGAVAMVRLEPLACERLKPMAAAFVDGLADLDTHSQAFERKLESIRTLGQEDIRKAAATSNRMLELPLRAMESGPLGGDSRISTSLGELRTTLEDLDPSRRGLLGTAQRRLLGVIPLGNRLRSYFTRYASGQKQLDAIIETLHRGQDELRKDNAAIEQEKANLWTTMRRLREYGYLAEEIDAALEARIAMVEVDDPERANALRGDAQFQVRQKLQDILTQLAVSVQGYLAMDLVRKNNLELIKGVDRATTTTVSALRTAVMVAQALAGQKLVLSQVTALNETTGHLIEVTSEMLRGQTAEIHTQAASTTISLDRLQASFANVYAAIESIDSYRHAAVEGMRQTVEVLTREVDRAQTYLERVQGESTAVAPGLSVAGRTADILLTDPRSIGGSAS